MLLGEILQCTRLRFSEVNYLMAGFMARWMDGLMDEWMDGWMERKIEKERDKHVGYNCSTLDTN